MLGLAAASIRFRAPAFLAAFASMLLGAVIVMTFASLIDVSRGSGISAGDQETLATMAAVVGGCGLIIVLFSVATTMTLAVRQRGTEIALLKSVGATPAQVRRMIGGEALASAELVADGTPYRFGVFALGIGIGVTVMASTAAAWLTARRTTRMGIAESLLSASQEQPRMRPGRVLIGCIFLAAGVSAATVSALLLDKAEISTLQLVAGEASLLSAVGLALLSPGLVRTCSAAINRALRPLLGISGYLSALNVQRRPHQMSGALIPIILLTAVATGTLYTQSIDDSIADAGGPTATDAKGVEALNYTVVGMLCVFAAIMLVNSLIAATTYRRAEFDQYRLLGLTPRQVIHVVAAEGVAIVVTGLVAGSLAGLLTIVPYNIARTDTLVPDIGPEIYIATAILVVCLTFIATLGATHQALRRPAIQRRPS